MSSLWKGEDHLVYVRGSGFILPFTEEYKRYRFRDIQVISVAKRSRIGMALLHAAGLLCFGIPAALTLALVDADSFGVGLAILVSFLSLGFLLFASLLIRHLILGPTCTCDIQTNLSQDRIRPLSRYHQALEVLEEVESEIRSSQAGLDGGGTSTGKEKTRPAAAREGARLHIAGSIIPTFIATILFGLGSIAGLHLESVALVSGLLFLVLIAGILLVVSLILSVRRATPESIRSALWVILGLLFLFIGSAVVYLLLVSARDPAYTLEFTGPLEAFAAVAVEGGMVFYGLFLALALSLLVTGAIGLVLGTRWKGKLRQAGAESVALEAPVEGSDERTGEEESDG